MYIINYILLIATAIFETRFRLAFFKHNSPLIVITIILKSDLKNVLKKNCFKGLIWSCFISDLDLKARKNSI